MKEFVLVTFIAKSEEREIVKEKLAALGEDFIPIKMDDSYDQWPDGEYITHAQYSGRINSAYATVIALSDPYLSDRMRISYISDDLKDRYRR
jgi:hypothetical protein